MEKIINVNILLVCGIPGVGKSYFSNLLKYVFIEEGFDAYIISFDEIFFKEMDLKRYKETRIKFFENFKMKANDRNKEEKIIYIIDDNFYFRSMRKPFFKYAKLNKYNYLEIHIKSELSYCLNNNNQRYGKELVPEEVIIKMNNAFENFSFSEELIYQIIVNDNNDITSSKIRDIHLNNIINSMKVINSTEKIKIIDKNKKALFLEEVEKQIRKNVGAMIKKFSIESKKISYFKKNYIILIKSLLYSNSDFIRININFDDYIILNKIIGFTKLNDYDFVNINDYINQFENFIYSNN